MVVEVTSILMELETYTYNVFVVLGKVASVIDDLISMSSANHSQVSTL